jgi:hypothetical protein
MIILHAQINATQINYKSYLNWIIIEVHYELPVIFAVQFFQNPKVISACIFLNSKQTYIQNNKNWISRFQQARNKAWNIATDYYSLRSQHTARLAQSVENETLLKVFHHL